MGRFGASAPYQLLGFQMSKYPTVCNVGVHGTIYSSKMGAGAQVRNELLLVRLITSYNNSSMFHS